MECLSYNINIIAQYFLYLGFVLVYDYMASSNFASSILVIIEGYYFYLCIYAAICWVCVFDGVMFILQRIIIPKNSELLMEESVRDDSAEHKALNRSSS